MNVLPLEQTPWNLAALKHNHDVTDSDLSTVFLHDEKVSRHSGTFHPNFVKLLVLCAKSDKLKRVVLSTLVRINSDRTIVEISLEIFSQRGIELIVSKNLGFKIEELKSAEYERVLLMGMYRSEYKEAIEELVQQLPRELQVLYYQMQVVIHTAVRHYEEGKAFTVESMRGPPTRTMRQDMTTNTPHPVKMSFVESLLIRVNELNG